MKSNSVVVIDYGSGNLLSVRRALEAVGAVIIETADPDLILSAPRIILPGVGAFGDCINELRKSGLDQCLNQARMKGIPLLGICLGMQLLFNSSLENGFSAGLSFISGQVIPIPNMQENGIVRKVPHTGWNNLLSVNNSKQWCGSVLNQIALGSSVYFSHSFMVLADNKTNIVAECNYDGLLIPAVVQSGNMMGCQFHPEKSGLVGLTILRNFLEL